MLSFFLAAMHRAEIIHHTIIRESGNRSIAEALSDSQYLVVSAARGGHPRTYAGAAISRRKETRDWAQLQRHGHRR